MTENEETIRQARAAFELEPRVNLHASAIRIDVRDGLVTLEGEVGSIAAKRLAARLVRNVAGVNGVVDHLGVTPWERRGDGEILDSYTRALLHQTEFRNCTIRKRDKGQLETLHEVVGDDKSGEIEFYHSGDIEFGAGDGVITLDGHVISLSHKRIAGVLAWWVPGSTNVLNRLHVVPAEQDTDDEITDAVRLALEMDPLVHADQVHVATHERVVTLAGLVAREEERRIVESDAWYIAGVHDVVNRIDVRA